jgi:hypothetical protein
MNNKRRYFHLASRTFWVLFGLFVLFSLFPFDSVFFDQTGVAEEIVKTGDDAPSPVPMPTPEPNPDPNPTPIPDPTPAPDPDLDLDPQPTPVPNPTPAPEDGYNTYTWSWTVPWALSLRGSAFSMTFKLPKKGVQGASINRANGEPASLSDHYRSLFINDAALLGPMIEKYKEIARLKQLTYMQTLDLVASSIQSIPYTLVLTSQGIKYKGVWLKCPCQTDFGYFKGDCKVLSTANGCCNDVEPCGVYSPVEFVTRKTGDCDTRSLLAFTILKKMGFDVAVMVSENEGHSVLGVRIPGQSPGDGRRGNIGEARSYFLWELTAENMVLGETIKGNDWEIAIN